MWHRTLFTNCLRLRLRGSLITCHSPNPPGSVHTFGPLVMPTFAHVYLVISLVSNITVGWLKRHCGFIMNRATQSQLSLYRPFYMHYLTLIDFPLHFTDEDVKAQKMCHLPKVISYVSIRAGM